MVSNLDISKAMTIKLDGDLPSYPAFVEGIRRAPKREFLLTQEQTELALKNALRYVPEEWHATLAPEFFRRTLYTRSYIRIPF